MANKRKYPKVQGYWVYSIKVPSINKYYIGISKQQCSKRWHKSSYVGTALEPYLQEWDSMIKTVLIDGLNKQDVFMYEGKIIDALSMNNLCLNSNRSGLITDDINDYMKQWHEDNPEYREQVKQYNKQYNKQLYENDAEYREYHNHYSKQWQKDHPEYSKQYNKQYYENNKEQEKQRVKKWRLKKKMEKEQNQLNLFS